ncbi:AhpC/TSA family protein [Solitalea sp. MAHUQ-68]|uniref:AhpC/TSA family protein n=1 Tax=Solitalea agri TaxID=2953739 RepID=A0A9X2F3U7_9SPHI|nr:TlpA disulfide reductase family protein [Solitalea agri]MCO4293734.1 AhpC/TSA family protein [Solitalea agri]
MKKNLLLTAFSVAALIGNAYAQSGEFTLTGKLTGLEDGKKVFLIKKNIENGKADTLASSTAKLNAFSLTGKVTNGDFCVFSVQDMRASLPIFMESAKIAIEGDVTKIRESKVTGSKSQDDLNAYNQLTAKFNDQQKTLNEQYVEARKAGDKAKMDEIATQFDAIDAEKNKTTEAFAASHTKSFVTPFLLVQNVGDENAAQYSKIYDQFAPQVKESAPAKSLKKRIDILSKTAVGQQGTMFTAKTPEGTDLSLKELLGKGKYTMLDFWASWCGPCRAENPNVVKLYEKYHAKGFNILGVSLDRDEKKWKDAIAADNLTWNHVSDLKYWQSEYAAMYGVQAIPATFLLDANGKIIAKNLRGEELAKKLEELLGSM